VAAEHSHPTIGAATYTAAAPSPLAEPLLDAKAAASLLSVRPSWIYEAVRTGRLPHLKIGRHVRFLRNDLERWVLDQRRSRLG
jgi:excisionase family DNA binding protein